MELKHETAIKYKNAPQNSLNKIFVRILSGKTETVIYLT